MQSLSRVQSQIQSRRMSMLEENRTLQRQLLQKRAKELESLRMGEDWDFSLQSKEQIETSLLHKYEAVMRRERALACSFTHQECITGSGK
ncbi:PREDICTED: protein IQ-DOMAIN 1-like [Erythranthe guttata]|uniref:protein IQ-DOMAIN 1-like n=1 Tax=Erythranthe guttata TaxID=4155 RepID=UPI00064E12B5|nr:PREDICTED: protein IQ-DOMAIN 1-like [Erythranthe guttata]|eukprot:XP_012831007.1 PREDICTED: protein IQ-DOMAIN 1-like [Erythranthe guttata]